MVQFIRDHKGNTTGVFIPIEEWQILILKYTELQKEETSAELADRKKIFWKTVLKITISIKMNILMLCLSKLSAPL